MMLLLCAMMPKVLRHNQSQLLHNPAASLSRIALDFPQSKMFIVKTRPIKMILHTISRYCILGLKKKFIWSNEVSWTNGSHSILVEELFYFVLPIHINFYPSFLILRIFISEIGVTDYFQYIIISFYLLSLMLFLYNIFIF